MRLKQEVKVSSRASASNKIEAKGKVLAAYRQGRSRIDPSDSLVSVQQSSGARLDGTTVVAVVAVDLEMLLLGLHLLDVVPVLAGVDLLPPQIPKQRVEAGGEQGAQDGADPVDPEVRREAAVDHGRAQ